MKNKLLLLTISFFPFYSISQNVWQKIAEPGSNLVVTEETGGYSYQGSPAPTHGTRYSIRKNFDYFQTDSVLYGNSGTMGCCSATAIFFIDSQNGFFAENNAGSAHIYRTVNSGKTWENINLGGIWNLSMEFLRPDFGYVYHAGAEWWTPNQFTHSYFYSSDKKTTNFITQKYIFAPTYRNSRFINDSTGFFTCRDTLAKKGVILKTNDYGHNWTEQKVVDSIFFKNIFFFSDSVGLVIGDSGSILIELGI
jgi:hypothetical protein